MHVPDIISHRNRLSSEDVIKLVSEKFPSDTWKYYGHSNPMSCFSVCCRTGEFQASHFLRGTCTSTPDLDALYVRVMETGKHGQYDYKIGDCNPTQLGAAEYTSADIIHEIMLKAFSANVQVVDTLLDYLDTRFHIKKHRLDKDVVRVIHYDEVTLATREGRGPLWGVIRVPITFQHMLFRINLIHRPTIALGHDGLALLYNHLASINWARAAQTAVHTLTTGIATPFNESKWCEEPLIGTEPIPGIIMSLTVRKEVKELRYAADGELPDNEDD